MDYSDDDDYNYDSDEIMDGTQDDASSVSDMDEEEDFQIQPTRDKKKSYEIDFDCLEPDAIQATIRADAEQIVTIFGVDPSTASLLLRHMGWNKERLMEKYMDNPTAMLEAAGIVVQQPAGPSQQAPIRTAPSSSRQATSTVIRRSARRPTADSKALPPVGCLICCDENPANMSSLLCNHNFCSDCWAEYLKGKIRDEGECQIKCMAEDCSVLVPDSFIKETCDAAVYARFEELILRHYVAHTKNLKYCPYPSCIYTISCSSAPPSSLTTVVPTVTCKKGHAFCFGCPIEGDHRPLICAVSKLWLQKCRDDSETANWIKSNTKECSKCQSTIEKNGGCNHMTCRKCKHEFCWVCMGPWSEHGTAWYNCNRFDEKGSVDARDAQSKSRASLERYLHYYNRWANHEQSAKLSVELYAKTEKKMEEMQITSPLTWIEVQFARKAVDEVERCRTTLKWTYAMAYYLEKSNAKELFEDNQRDLEKAVEDLSELLETPIDPEGIALLRQKMTDKTVYVQKRNEIMLEDTAKGYHENRWTWNVPVEGIDA
ncbi:hypothetical protein AURDEDRAFT_111086 [Auricularia subglabra TFB-10046 SS5]|nr:hypothetical protein AURDEDRAFT_111086 [Auricularia subglabra TFB-10046 SS5]